jgi:hypothetical protein
MMEEFVDIYIYCRLAKLYWNRVGCVPQGAESEVICLSM